MAHLLCNSLTVNYTSFGLCPGQSGILGLNRVDFVVWAGGWWQWWPDAKPILWPSQVWHANWWGSVKSW